MSYTQDDLEQLELFVTNLRLARYWLKGFRAADKNITPLGFEIPLTQLQVFLETLLASAKEERIGKNK